MGHPSIIVVVSSSVFSFSHYSIWNRPDYSVVVVLLLYCGLPLSASTLSKLLWSLFWYHTSQYHECTGQSEHSDYFCHLIILLNPHKLYCELSNTIAI